MVRVKICGLTNLKDAKTALEAGADYLGFILYPPSPRAVTTEAAGSIIRELKSAYPSRFTGPHPPRMVGVFVNEHPATIAAALDQSGLDLAQLSGDEAADHVTHWNSPIYGRAYKAIRPLAMSNALDLISRYTNYGGPLGEDSPSILVDTPHGQLYGGSGEVGDWELVAELVAKLPHIMLAGGLTPANIADAVRKVRPFAVDVASGVEEHPGIKNHDLIWSFIRIAKHS